eukprot:TRINITY_DN889_c0_g1_i1.p1 TRINITY_DN889_c0_g1~~TRINITY_DN889_c0_g1_i1.p1  ORF type:complete len:417 (-),score=85.76 TRINITY_DN889_c0_g1_i1:464-1714(-)
MMQAAVAGMAPPPPPPVMQQQQPQQQPQGQQQWYGPPQPQNQQQQPAMMANEGMVMAYPPPPPQHHLQQPQFYAPPQFQQQQQPLNADEIKSLWVGDLQPWMDENYLSSIFGYSGELMSVKIIRNKHTGQSEGYGFVEFISRASAEKFLQAYNGTMMPNTDQIFRLNWASSGSADRRQDGGADYSIFVGDLASDVTDQSLLETFQSRYPSVKGAKVIMDIITGHSKGYGFVKFGSETEKTRAMTEMNGVYCSSRPMRINEATSRKTNGFQQHYSTRATNGSSYQGSSNNDSNNTTIFVGGLDPNATEEDLKQLFGAYGELVSVKIPFGKGCGFVQYSNRASAEEALQNLNGAVIGQQNIRLSWGRTPANRQVHSQPSNPPNQWNGAYYGQEYKNYGFAPSQDPTAYQYGGYSGYGN